jgi:hypothetical protein
MPVSRAADSRDVRAAALEEEMTEQCFSGSVTSDEDGGFQANIAASEASNQTADRAPPC